MEKFVGCLNMLVMLLPIVCGALAVVGSFFKSSLDIKSKD